jgi:hypothetical protein
MRITPFSDEGPYNPDTTGRHVFAALKRMLDELTERLEPSECVGGYEIKGKTGDYVKPHLHLHFTSNQCKDTIVKSVKRYFVDKHDIKLIGNQMYYIKIVPFIDNLEKFMRYPLKQYTDDKELINSVSRGFNDEDLKKMRTQAYAVWLTGCEVQNAKQDRRDEKDTLWDRLEQKLLKSETKNYMELIIQFYMEENRPINNTTISGYYNLWMLKSKAISTKTYAELLLKGNGTL